MLNSMKPVVSYERHSQIKVTMWKGGDVLCERRERSIADPNDRKKKKEKTKKNTQAPHRHARYRQRHLLTGENKKQKNKTKNMAAVVQTYRPTQRHLQALTIIKIQGLHF